MAASLSSNRSGPAGRQHGLSLIELMISITIGLIILAALTTTFVNQSRIRAELDKTGRLIDNGRYALEVLGENVRLAGFYGELDPGNISVPNPADTTPPDPCTTVAASISPVLPLHLQGYSNATSATKPSCVPSVLDGTDILVVRRAETNSIAVTAVSGTVQPYLQASLCQYDTESYKIENAVANFTLRKKNCTNTGGGSVADLWRMLTHIYYIDSNNVAGDGIPTLKRYEISTTGTPGAPGNWTTTPLVEGVQNMQIDYGLDSLPAGAQDGVVDSWTDCSACTNQDWADVIAVRIHLLVRNLETTSGFTDDKTYVLGSAGTFGPFSNGYKRRVYNQFIRIINPASRREAP